MDVKRSRIVLRTMPIIMLDDSMQAADLPHLIPLRKKEVDYVRGQVI